MMMVGLAVGSVLGAALVLWWRRRIIGAAAGGRLLGITGAIVVLIIVGTVVDVSGVALAFPVLAAVGFELWRSPWRGGDGALFLLGVLAGTALGYQAATTVETDTGSYGDQGALALAVLSAAMLAVAGIDGRRRMRRG